MSVVRTSPPPPLASTHSDAVLPALRRRIWLADPPPPRTFGIIWSSVTFAPLIPGPTFHPESEARNFVLEVFGSKALKMQDGDAVVDADRLDESDDEELGPIDGLGVEQVAPAVPDPENSGKELEALSSQAGELASLMKTLIGDIKALEERVDVLAPREPAP